VICEVVGSRSWFTEVLLNRPSDPEHPAFAFLGANTPWVYALAVALAQRGSSTAAISPYDWLNYHRLRPRWPASSRPDLLQREFWIMPPGYVGYLDLIFAPLLRRKLSRCVTKLATKAKPTSGGTPWIIAMYPWFERALSSVPDERLVYLNLDDYVLYQPKRAQKVLRQEAELIRRAAITLCLSQRQVDNLQARYSERAVAIRHFPLGVPEDYLNPTPDCVLRPQTVGYIGNLADRVDWRLIGAVARALPNITFLFVGNSQTVAGGGNRSDWKRDRTAALALPNIHSIGQVPQEAVQEHYWNFDISWIPYATDHAFNQAACPTKIMDGLASGRPIISTDIPECRQYPEWITIVRNADEAISAIQCLLASPIDQRRSRAQVDFARGHTWSQRAATLLGLVAAVR
jgi:teichuronic acid biosynthesis glycosyltransferase TuaH